MNLAAINPNWQVELAQAAAEEWSKIAGEAVTCEVPREDSETIYAYGSELACLRLFAKFRKSKVDVFYSETLQTWVFSKD